MNEGEGLTMSDERRPEDKQHRRVARSFRDWPSISSRTDGKTSVVPCNKRSVEHAAERHANRSPLFVVLCGNPAPSDFGEILRCPLFKRKMSR